MPQERLDLQVLKEVQEQREQLDRLDLKELLDLLDQQVQLALPEQQEQAQRRFLIF